MEQATSDEKSFQLLSGAAYGSSFVGMVHILKTSKTESDQNAQSESKSKRESGTGTDMNHIAGTYPAVPMHVHVPFCSNKQGGMEVTLDDHTVQSQDAHGTCLTRLWAPRLTPISG